MAWVANHKKLTMLLAGITVAALAALVVLIVFYQKPTQNPDVSRTAPLKPEAPAEKFYSPLTGVELPDEAASKRPITAVVIENSPSARPQSGMQQAEVVYESIAEAGITRFVNLYQQNKPGLVGPVRSLRPYLVDWIKPWDASIAHVGGSKRALDEVRNGSYRDLDQMLDASAYWRSSDRYAPHNVYTNFEQLDAANTSKNYANSTPKPLAHTDTQKVEQPGATQITVNMSSHLYNSAWSYHAESNMYHRQQGGAPHVDREEGQITSRSVVILSSHMDHIMEDGWRENYHTVGTGDGVVFQDGTVTEVTWHKPAAGEQHFFTHKTSGEPFKLARGKVWISAIPANDGGSVSWQ